MNEIPTQQARRSKMLLAGHTAPPARAPGYAVRQHGRRIVLPVGDASAFVEVSVWRDSEENMERFAAKLGLKRRSERQIVTTAVLVRHAHNTYNSNAISVSTPASSGGTLAARHLGYLRERTLKSIGPTNLPDLIEFAGGEVEVTIRVTGTDELEVALPDGPVLGDAIRNFLAPFGVTASGAPRWVDTQPEQHTHSGRAPDTVRTLTLLDSQYAEPQPVIDIVISTQPAADPATRTLHILETSTGRHLGTIAGGILNLEDERDREAVLPLLAAEGIPVAQPVTAPRLVEDGTWPADVVPNAWVRPRSGALDLRARNPKEPNSQESFAIYNPTNDTLWVEDSHLVAPALRYFHRMGVDPTALGLPRKAWALDTEVSFRALRDPSKYRHERLPLPKPALRIAARAYLPEGVLTDDDVTWVGGTDNAVPSRKESRRRLRRKQAERASQAGALRPVPENFLLFERYVTARTDLFPEHDLTGETAPCRLCGASAATFTTPISTAEGAYCHTCLNSSRDGLVEDRTRAAAALKELSSLEFDGQPMLESQLTTLHVNPQTPVDPNLIDRMLVLRWAIGRRRVAWTLLLEAAGFAENGLRTSRGTLIRSRDGHLCLSMREKAVCDFLHQHGIGHQREPLYPLDPDYNPTGLRRADWQLADGTLVELWGLPDDPRYAAKMEQKRLLAARHGLRLVELDDRNLAELPSVFAPWLEASAVTGWTWSPLLVTSPTAAEAARQRKKAAPARGDNRGRNDFNTQTQRERVARCAEAVQYQAEGLTRAEIAARMGAGVNGVEQLLRDGKFYANPPSDPPRLERAKYAAAARRHGQTRAQFQADQQITAPKAQEAWRDATVLFDD